MSQPPPRDLLHTKEIKALVRDTYHAVASPAGAVARKLYSAEELAQVPQIAIDGALGVASPLRHAGIEPGDTVPNLLRHRHHPGHTAHRADRPGGCSGPAGSCASPT